MSTGMFDRERKFVKRLTSNGELYRVVNTAGVEMSCIFQDGVEVWSCNRDREDKMVSDWIKNYPDEDGVKMGITEEEIERMAYRLIRKEVRRFDRTTTDSELANYVRGVVDLQTELYGELSKAESDK